MDYIIRYTLFFIVVDVSKDGQVGHPSDFVKIIDHVKIVLLNFFKQHIDIETSS